MEKVNIVQVQTTVESEELGNALADGLLGTYLCACVKMLPGVYSTFRWEGKIEDAEEILLVVTTTKEKSAAVVEYINENHDYEIPEIIIVDIVGSSEGYNNWVMEQTHDPKEDN